MIKIIHYFLEIIRDMFVPMRKKGVVLMLMEQFGDGSRTIVAVYWKTNNGGHVLWLSK